MNTRLLTVEDANSILEHFGKAVLDYYTLDTRLLVDNKWFAYDFITVLSDDGIILTVNNNLWTGGYYINDCNIDDYTVTANNNSLLIEGTGLEYVVITFELSSDFLFADTIFELNYNPIHFPFIKPFYEEKNFTVGFNDKNNNPASNVNVKDKINDIVLTTDDEGLINLNTGVNSNGLYDYLIETMDNNQLEYKLPYMNIKADLPVILTNKQLFKNKKQLISFKFLFDDIYAITDEMLFNSNDIVLTVNGTDYTVNNYADAVFDFFVDLENINTDTVSMVLNIEGNDYLNSNKLIFVERLGYFATDDESVLQSELSNDDGADVIVYTGSVLSGMLNVDRECEIRFTGTVAGGGFQVNNDLVLVTPSFEDVRIVVGGDASLTVDGGIFVHTKDCVIKNNGSGIVTVRDCSFVDNYTCISSKSDVFLSDCVFELGDDEYLDSKTVAFVECLNDLTLDYCNFNVNLNVGSIGFGYLFFKLAGSVNGVSKNNLNANETFPVLKNTGMVDVGTERFNVHGKTNKCMVWTIENTNTVYSNDLEVDWNV